MSATRRPPHRKVSWIALLALAAGGWGCSSETAEERATDGPPPPYRAASADGALSVVLEGDLIVHVFSDSVAATAPDGMIRVHVQRLEPDKLIRHAGAAKDAFAAHGWEVSQEQHYEQAIRVELTRGGLAKAPTEKRDVWWVARPRGVFMCDGIARASAFDALGEVHKSRCLSVTLAPAPAAETAAEPDTTP